MKYDQFINKSGETRIEHFDALMKFMSLMSGDPAFTKMIDAFTKDEKYAGINMIEVYRRMNQLESEEKSDSMEG